MTSRMQASLIRRRGELEGLDTLMRSKRNEGDHPKRCLTCPGHRKYVPVVSISVFILYFRFRWRGGWVSGTPFVIELASDVSVLWDT